jgi:MFS family permease
LHTTIQGIEPLGRIGNMAAVDAAEPHQHRGNANSIALIVLIVMFSGYLSIGLVDGGGGVLWPEVIDGFGVSDGLYGVASGLGLVIAFPVMLFAGRIADRFDKRTILLGAFAAMALSSGALAIGTGAAMLTLVMVLRGFSVSLFDLGNNSIAIEYERDSGHHVLGPLHASYSGGALLGALVIWAAFALDANYQAVFSGFAIAFAIASVVAWRARSGAPAPSVRTEPVSITATIRLLRVRDIRLLGAITALCMFCEIVISQWSGIYLNDERHTGSTTRVLAIACYGALMLIGRAFNGPIVQKLGTRRTLIAEGASTAAGAALIFSGGPAWLAIFGAGLAGLGLAGMIPLALGISGVLHPAEGATASGAILLIGYIGLALGPFIAGLVSTLTSARGVMILAFIGGGLVVLLGLQLQSTTMKHERPMTTSGDASDRAQV